MTVQLLGAIHRYQGQSGDSKPEDATVPTGSQFYEIDTTDTYVWDGSDWTAAPAFNGLFMPTADEKDAMDGANAPDVSNVFITAADVVTLPTSDEKTFLDAVPTSDPVDGVTIWADSGVLKIASAP